MAVYGGVASEEKLGVLPMMDFHFIEKRAVRTLLQMERATVRFDLDRVLSLLQKQQQEYALLRIRVAEQTGNYRLPKFEDWKPQQIGMSWENSLCPELHRARQLYHRLEHVQALLQVNQLLGLPEDRLLTRYQIQDEFPRITCLGPIQFQHFNHDMKSLIIPPQGKKLVVAGYDNLEQYVLARHSEDPFYQEDLANVFKAFGQEFFPDIPGHLQYKLLRCVSLQHATYGSGETLASLFKMICLEENIPVIGIKRAQEILQRFSSRYLLATGFVEEIKHLPEITTPQGRSLLFPSQIYFLTLTASDISKTGLANVLEDERLQSFKFEPHLIFYDELVFSVDEDADLDFVFQYLREDFHMEGFPDHMVSCVQGETWKDGIEKKRALAGFVSE